MGVALKAIFGENHAFKKETQLTGGRTIRGLHIFAGTGGHAPLNKCCTFSHNLPELSSRCDLRLRARKELGF